jgi:hypothetical protein
MNLEGKKVFIKHSLVTSELPFKNQGVFHIKDSYRVLKENDWVSTKTSTLEIVY